MENFSYHVPFYVVDGGVATTGHTSDMSAKKVGIFARQTFNVVTGVSTEKELFFAQAPNGGKDWYGYPVSGTHKSPYFMVDDVEDIYVSLPQQLQNEEWIIGYNGSPSSVGLSYVKGEATRIKFLFTGEPTYRFFGGPKEYLVSHTPHQDCDTPCESGNCADNVVDDPIAEAKKHVDLINNHTELRKFGVTAYLVWDDYRDEGASGTVTAVRTMKITLKRTAAGAVRTSEIQTMLDGVDGIVKSSGTVVVTVTAGAGTTTEGISDDYVVTQTSYEEDVTTAGLSSNVTFRYAHIPAIEAASWIQTDETDPATADAATPVSGRKVGIRVTAGYIDPKFGNCSFNPLDYYETQPIRFEVSLYRENEERCDISKWPSVLKTREGQIARQSGEWVIREKLMKEQAYLEHINQWSLEPREREAFEMKQLDTVDRSAYYKLYYVRFRASYGNNSFRKHGVQEKFTTVFAVKESDSSNDTALDTNVVTVLETLTGITRHTNS